MRAPGIAAIVLGAVIALSATLGMSYRSEAAPLDDPSTSASDSSSPAVTDSSSATDSTTPAPVDSTSPAATDDATTPAATDDATTPAADPSSPTADDSSSPTDDPTSSDDPAPRFGFFAEDALTAPTTSGISFRGSNSATIEGLDVNVDGTAPTASVQYQAADSEGTPTGTVFDTAPDYTVNGDAEEFWEGSTCTDVTGDVPPIDCTASFGSERTSGLWAVTATQTDPEGSPGETGTSTSYVYIPPAPTAEIQEGDGSTSFSGTGIVGDKVTVTDSEGFVCRSTVSGESSTGTWSCDPEVFEPDETYTAVQTDAGNASNDGLVYYLGITAGGISLPTIATLPVETSNAPVMTYHYFPGGITAQSAPAAGFDSVFSVFYRWNQGVGDEGAFTALTTCPYEPDDEGENPATGPITCTFTAPGPGYYNPDSYQISTGSEGEGSDNADDYFLVPVTPTITSTNAVSGGRVRVTGTGVATDGIRVVVDGSSVVCTSTAVAAGGTWTCTTGALSTGTHSLQAYDVDSGAGQIDAILDDDPNIVYMSGGLSALSSPASVRVTGSTATPAPTPTATDFSNWFFTITGVDLDNVHPGDTFTVTGSGLPPGATISGELHSKAVSIGSATVGSDGTFSLPVVVPADFPAGAHTIVMTLTPAGGAPAVSQQPLKVVAAAASSGSGAEPSPTPDDNSSQIEGAEGPGIDHDGPNSNILTHGLNSIADVIAHPAKVPAALEIGLVLLIFAVLPGHLLNATLAEQYERFNRRRPKRNRPVSAWLARVTAFLHRAPFVAGVALTTVTALLFGFADPRFGFSLASLRLFLGLAIALAIVSYLVNMVTGRIMRGRWKVDVEVNLRPLGLILTVVGVVVSRLLDFSPGFLIGLVLGLVISEKHLAKHAWRAVLLRTGLLLGLALLAWLAFSLFDAREEGGTFASELAIETLVAITTEAIVGLLVELLPLRLLEGEKLYQRSKVLWGALYLVAVFIFVVAVVPWEGNWAELGSSLWAWIGIVVGFGILATGTYIYFRVRSRDEVDEHIDKDEDGDELVPIGSEDDER